MHTQMKSINPSAMSPMALRLPANSEQTRGPMPAVLAMNGRSNSISGPKDMPGLLGKRGQPLGLEALPGAVPVRFGPGVHVSVDFLRMVSGGNLDDGWDKEPEAVMVEGNADEELTVGSPGIGERRDLPLLAGKGKVLGKSKDRKDEVEELFKEMIYFEQKRRKKYGRVDVGNARTIEGILKSRLGKQAPLAENILYDKDLKPALELRYVRSHKARARLSELWNLDLYKSKGVTEIPGLLDAQSKRDLKLLHLVPHKIQFRSKFERLGFISRDGNFGDAYHFNALKMPRISNKFEEVDFGERLIEAETRGNKTRSLTSKQNDSRKEAGYSKSKKGENKLIRTARMSQHLRKRVRVSWDECFGKFSEIERKVGGVRQRALLKIASFKEGEKEEYRMKLLNKGWERVCRAVVKMQRYFQRDNEQNAKKVSVMCAKERKRVLAKNKRNVKDYVLRAKRLNREMLGYWKKQGRELTELKKKRERVEQELNKKEEERKEQIKQKKKIQYLIKRSEFYAQIMAQKLGIEGRDEDQTGQELLSKEEVEKAEYAVQSLIQTNESRVNKFQNEINNGKQVSGAPGKPVEPVDPALESSAKKDIPLIFENGKDSQGVDFDFSKIDIENRSTLVKCPRNFNGRLKEYQLKGLRWLDNLYEQGINGILADEMGLGKTVQAIALMTHVAEKKGGWGPFLVIAPTTTLFNWKFECTRFSPRLKILPYWGARKDREILRKSLKQSKFGRADSDFHIVITSYSFAVKDHKYLDRIKWQYIILDEAQAIKCIRSQRWRILLSLKSRNKMLLTGTPIQNTMAELWALLHFIMPQLFDSHQEFQEWFSKDIEAHSRNKGGASLNQIQLNRLHAILKPFMLRRVKKDVEKEIGKKIVQEYVCDMSRRQKLLYNIIKKRICLSDLMQMEENKQKNQNLMNLVMQFRKVCNHPELFERKLEKTPLLFSRSLESKCHSVYRRGRYNMTCVRVNQLEHPFDLKFPRVISLLFRENIIKKNALLDLELNERWATRLSMSQVEYDLLLNGNDKAMMAAMASMHYLARLKRAGGSILRITNESAVYYGRRSMMSSFEDIILEDMGLPATANSNSLNWSRNQFGVGQGNPNNWIRVREVRVTNVFFEKYPLKKSGSKFLIRGVKLNNGRSQQQNEVKMITNFRIGQEHLAKGDKKNGRIISKPKFRTLGHRPSEIFSVSNVYSQNDIERNFKFFVDPVQSVRYNEIIDQRVAPIDRRLLDVHIPFQIQFPEISSLISDSSKLSFLNKLLGELKKKKHRVLIFCQMTKMMDILEDYLQFRKYTYFRLDGGSAINERRDMVQQFQSRDDVFVFLLSTRAGGLGVTLTAADDVIFYDNDWNPTMDAQAEDRAHRIGRLKDVYVYRLVTKNTIEERILRRAQQKQNVQKTVYSGEVFKANTFSSNEMMNLCFDEDELIQRQKNLETQKKIKKAKKKEDALLKKEKKGS